MCPVHLADNGIGIGPTSKYEWFLSFVLQSIYNVLNRGQPTVLYHPKTIKCTCELKQSGQLKVSRQEKESPDCFSWAEALASIVSEVCECMHVQNASL